MTRARVVGGLPRLGDPVGLPLSLLCPCFGSAACCFCPCVGGIAWAVSGRESARCGAACRPCLLCTGGVWTAAAAYVRAGGVGGASVAVLVVGFCSVCVVA